MSNDKIKLCVIGGGPAGMMCAGKAAESGCEVTLFEKMERVGRKLAITGKGRCNVTNNCTLNEFIENVPTNPRFMYGAYSSFTSQDTMDFFEEQGVKLKTERGRRVFPESDRAYDIVDALKRYCTSNGVNIVHARVEDIVYEQSCVKGVKANGKFIPFDRVAVCTGGVSYPKCGSDGDGYKFAKKCGINVVTPKPSLVPIETVEEWVPLLMGLSLKNVRVALYDNDKKSEIYSDFGELLFTHFGLSGPTILSASSHIKNMASGKYGIRIDLKPALDEKTLDARLLSDFDKNKNKDYANSLSGLLPQKMIPVFVKLSGISGTRKVNSITKAERGRILGLLKCFECTVKGFRPIEEAIITSGGIDVKELEPKSMESKKIKGLYFAGEVIDVDAYTGGYNLQIAFSTANAVACAVANS